jgi:hypothetical protein
MARFIQRISMLLQGISAPANPFLLSLAIETVAQLREASGRVGSNDLNKTIETADF